MRVVSLVLIISLTGALGAYINPWDAWTNNNNNNIYHADRPLKAHYSTTLLNELKEFVTLISPAKLAKLVLKHQLHDADFQKAFAYVSGPEFPKLVKEMVTYPDSIKILKYLHVLVDSAITDMDNESADGDDDLFVSEVSQSDVLAVLLEAALGVDLPTAEQEPLSSSAFSPDYNIRSETVDMAWNAPSDDEDEAAGSDLDLQSMEIWFRKLYTRQIGSVQAFVQELVDSVPRAEYVKMIEAKKHSSAEYAQFYKALRGPQLRPMVEEGMKSRNAVAAFKTLREHGVDVQALVPILFTVISWGPAP